MVSAITNIQITWSYWMTVQNVREQWYYLDMNTRIISADDMARRETKGQCPCCGGRLAWTVRTREDNVTGRTTFGGRYIACVDNGHTCYYISPGKKSSPPRESTRAIAIMPRKHDLGVFNRSTGKQLR